MEQGAAEGIFMALPTMASKQHVQAVRGEIQEIILRRGAPLAAACPQCKGSLKPLASIHRPTDRQKDHLSGRRRGIGRVRCLALGQPEESPPRRRRRRYCRPGTDLGAAAHTSHSSARPRRHVLVVDEVHAYASTMNAFLSDCSSSMRLLAQVQSCSRRRFRSGSGAVRLSLTAASGCRHHRCRAVSLPDDGRLFPGVEEKQMQANYFPEEPFAVEFANNEADVESYLETDPSRWPVRAAGSEYRHRRN